MGYNEPVADIQARPGTRAVANMTHWHLGTRGLLEIKSPLVQLNVPMGIFIKTLADRRERSLQRPRGSGLSVCQQSCRKALLEARPIARYRDWIHH